MVYTFCHLICVHDFCLFLVMISSDISWLHNKSSLSVWCVFVLSRSTFLLLRWNFCWKSHNNLEPKESHIWVAKRKSTWREVCISSGSFILNVLEESQHALCSLLSNSAHWPPATPQWCRPVLAFLLASTAWWMRKNDCDISYRFHINASGSNAAPDTLISILVVTGEHKKGEAHATLKNGRGVLLKWLPVYTLVFSRSWRHPS